MPTTTLSGGNLQRAGAGQAIGTRLGIPTEPILPKAATPEQLQAESVSADGSIFLARYAQVLPRYIDETTADLGDDLYDKMLLDSAVIAAVTTLKAGILEDGVHLTSAIEDKDHPDFALAATIQAFCESVLADLVTPLDTVLWDMCDALATGNRLAEIVYGKEIVNGKSALVVTAIKTKPRQSYAFVVDAYNNLIGVMALIPGVSYGVLPGLVVGDPAQIPNLLPREKFAVLSIRPRNADPRGTSLIRPAYKPWWQKQQMYMEYLKYLVQFGSPIVIGTQAPNSFAGDSPIVPLTGVTVTPMTSFMQSLQSVRNGGVVTLPYGATVEISRASGNGEAFLNAFDLQDRQITTAILSQTLATMEGKHNARAASDNHADILQTLIRQLKLQVQRMVGRDMLKPMIRFNFGPDAAKRLVPNVNLGAEEGVDVPTLMTAYVGAGYKIDPSQFMGIDAELSVPERDPDSIALLQQQAELGLQGQQAGVEAQKAAASAPAPAAGNKPVAASGGPATKPATPVAKPAAKGDA